MLEQRLGISSNISNSEDELKKRVFEVWDSVTVAKIRKLIESMPFFISNFVCRTSILQGGTSLITTAALGPNPTIRVYIEF